MPGLACDGRFRFHASPAAQVSEQEKALREFACGICKAVLNEPCSTPCGARAAHSLAPHAVCHAVAALSPSAGSSSSCRALRCCLLPPVPAGAHQHSATPLPAGHNFCKPCLEKKFGHIADEIDAGAATGRSLRVRKVVKPCPTCKVSAVPSISGAAACLDPLRTQGGLAAPPARSVPLLITSRQLLGCGRGQLAWDGCVAQRATPNCLQGWPVAQAAA